MIFFTILIKLLLLLNIKNLYKFFINDYIYEINGDIIIPQNYQLTN